MNCKIYLSEIEEAIDGALLSSEAHTHINACRKCLGVYEERVVIRSLVGELKKIEAPPDFEFRLRARMAALKPAQRHPSQYTRFVPSLVSIALAACFALTIAGMIFLKRVPTPQSISQLSNAPAIASPPLVVNTKPDRPTGSEILKTENGSARRVKVEKVGANYTFRRQTVALSSTERKQSTAARQLPDSESADLSFKGASVLTKEGAPVHYAVASNMSPISIQVCSSAESLRIIWRDEQGNARPVSMNFISFGAQNSDTLSRQNSSSVHPVAEGVW